MRERAATASSFTLQSAITNCLNLDTVNERLSTSFYGDLIRFLDGGWNLELKGRQLLIIFTEKMSQCWCKPNQYFPPWLLGSYCSKLDTMSIFGSLACGTMMLNKVFLVPGAVQRITTPVSVFRQHEQVRFTNQRNILYSSTYLVFFLRLILFKQLFCFYKCFPVLHLSKLQGIWSLNLECSKQKVWKKKERAF